MKVSRIFAAIQFCQVSKQYVTHYELGGHAGQQAATDDWQKASLAIAKQSSGVKGVIPTMCKRRRAKRLPTCVFLEIRVGGIYADMCVCVCFQGMCVGGLPHGEGLCKYPNGDTYDGAWRNGQRCVTLS